VQLRPVLCSLKWTAIRGCTVAAEIILEQMTRAPNKKEREKKTQQSVNKFIKAIRCARGKK